MYSGIPNRLAWSSISIVILVSVIVYTVQGQWSSVFLSIILNFYLSILVFYLLDWPLEKQSSAHFWISTAEICDLVPRKYFFKSLFASSYVSTRNKKLILVWLILFSPDWFFKLFSCYNHILIHFQLFLKDPYSSRGTI